MESHLGVRIESHPGAADSGLAKGWTARTALSQKSNGPAPPPRPVPRKQTAWPPIGPRSKTLYSYRSKSLMRSRSIGSNRGSGKKAFSGHSASTDNKRWLLQGTYRIKPGPVPVTIAKCWCTAATRSGVGRCDCSRIKPLRPGPTKVRKRYSTADDSTCLGY